MKSNLQFLNIYSLIYWHCRDGGNELKLKQKDIHEKNRRYF